MKRSNLSEKQSCDICIIGGGIYGAWTAYAASLRGLDVCLIDKGDWASGTSSASTKLIHGGLRYLEYYDFGLVRKSVQERELLQKLIPHRIRSLRFWLPIYNNSERGRLMMKAGLTLYELLAGSSVSGRRHEYHSKKATLRNLSGLNSAGLRGSFTYYDARTEDSRLVLDVVTAAVENGARAANYAEARGLIREKGRVAGVEIKDLISGKKIRMESRVVVNTAGAWGEDFYPDNPEERWRARITKGVHIVLPSIEGLNEGLFLATPQDNRMFFILPFMGKVMVGTTDTDYNDSPDNLKADKADTDYLLEAFAHYFPNAARRQLGSFTGLRVLQHVLAGSASEVTRDWLGDEIEKGHWVSLGGKITSARLDAEHLLNKIYKEEFKESSRELTGEKPLPCAPPDDYNQWYNQSVSDLIDMGLENHSAKMLPLRYGCKVKDVAAFIAGIEDGKTPIIPGEPFLWGEIEWSKKNEMSYFSDDVLRRRLGLSFISEATPDILYKIERKMLFDKSVE